MQRAAVRTKKKMFLRIALLAAALCLLCVTTGCAVSFGAVRADKESTVLALNQWDAAWTEKLEKLPALETLDLRGAAITAEDAAAIQAALGERTLLWSIPLGSGAYSSDSTEIAVSDLAAAQVQNLRLFPNLKKADLRGSGCAAEIAAIAKELPDCELLWSIQLLGKTVENTAAVLDLSNTVLSSADVDVIVSAAQSLPAVSTVDVSGTGLPLSDIDVLSQRLGDIALRYTVEIAGRSIENDAAAVDLSGLSLGTMDTDALAAALAHFTAAEIVDLHDTGLTAQQMYTLYDALPDAALLWTVPLYGKTFESDIERMDLSGTEIEDLTEFHETVGFFRKLNYVDMCDCGLSNETMDELNNSYQNIRIVWAIYLRGERTYRVRTDATTFSTALKANPKKKLDDRTAAPLRYCTDLVALDLGHNKVRDLSILEGMKNLKYLILVGCDASDITPLTNLNELLYVELFANDIADLTPLANKPHLLDLNICNNEITDLSPLFTNPQLERLWASRNPLAEGQAEAAAEALPNCTFDYSAWNATGNGWRKHDRFYEMRGVFGLPIID